MPGSICSDSEGKHCSGRAAARRLATFQSAWQAHLIIGDVFDSKDVEGHHEAINRYQQRLVLLVHLHVHTDKSSGNHHML